MNFLLFLSFNCLHLSSPPSSSFPEGVLFSAIDRRSDRVSDAEESFFSFSPSPAIHGCCGMLVILKGLIKATMERQEIQTSFYSRPLPALVLSFFPSFSVYASEGSWITLFPQDQRDGETRAQRASVLLLIFILT